MPTILVIEDQKPLLEEIVAILQFNDYSVYSATGGYEGIQLIHDVIPDLIISDIMMPHGDGYAVLKHLQDDPDLADIPFLFLTAKNEPRDIRQGMILGADDYITKPFEIEDLLLTIDSRLNRRNLLVRKYQEKINDLEHVIASTIPHELRTPLVSILGYSEILIEEAHEMDVQQIIDMATTVHKAGNHLHSRINKLLTYARVKSLLHNEEQHLILYGETCPDVEAQISNAAERVIHEFGRIGDLRLRVDNMTLRMRSEDLYLMVKELVENACKFSKPRTLIEVTLQATAENGRLQIRDHGTSMSPEQIDAISAFRQFERNYQQQSGLGLGLATVITLTQLYRGSIVFTPYSADGLLIEVQLPLI